MAEKKAEEIDRALLPYAIFLAGMLIGILLYVTDEIIKAPVPLFDVAAIIVAAFGLHAAYMAEKKVSK